MAASEVDRELTELEREIKRELPGLNRDDLNWLLREIGRSMDRVTAREHCEGE